MFLSCKALYNHANLTSYRCIARASHCSIPWTWWHCIFNQCTRAGACTPTRRARKEKCGLMARFVVVLGVNAFHCTAGAKCWASRTSFWARFTCQCLSFRHSWQRGSQSSRWNCESAYFVGSSSTLQKVHVRPLRVNHHDFHRQHIVVTDPTHCSLQAGASPQHVHFHELDCMR